MPALFTIGSRDAEAAHASSSLLAVQQHMHLTIACGCLIIPHDNMSKEGRMAIHTAISCFAPELQLLTDCTQWTGMTQITH